MTIARYLASLALVAAIAAFSASSGQTSTKYEINPPFNPPCQPAKQRCGVPIKITSPRTLNAVVGKPYSFRLRAKGGMGTGRVDDYNWKVKSGSLPPGISRGSGGLLRGTATKAGEWRFTVCAWDVQRRSQKTGRFAYQYTTCGSVGFTVKPPPNPYPFDGNYEGSSSVSVTATCAGFTTTQTAAGTLQFTVLHGVVDGRGTIAVSGSTGTATVPSDFILNTLYFVLGPGGSASFTDTISGSTESGSCVLTATGTATGTRVSTTP